MNLAFRRVAVIENPSSGQFALRRKAILRATFAALQTAGVASERLVISGPGSGEALARGALARGCDAIIVCGGDGTVHQVLQCLVGTSVALGVVPLGTANALAADLGLTHSPAKAIHALLQAERSAVPVGRIAFHDADGAQHQRYFLVAAGVGADALLMARLDPALKRRVGYVLYLLEACRLWASHPFPLFKAKFRSSAAQSRTEDVSQLLAVRVRSFGGVLGRLAPGSSLYSRSLNLLAFKTRSRFRYLRFLLAVIGKRHTFSNAVELIAAESVDCEAAVGSPAVYVEADGELLGELPVRIDVAAETVTLLIPRHAEP